MSLSYKCWSFQRTNSSRGGGLSRLSRHLQKKVNHSNQNTKQYPVRSDLFVNRFHRRLTGASTLTRRKNGRWMRRSKVAPSQISVVTQCSRHLLVTKSRSKSTRSNTISGCALPFSSTSWVCSWTPVSGSSAIWVWPLFVSPSNWKPWCRVKYSAMACLPEHMPFNTMLSVHNLFFVFSW